MKAGEMTPDAPPPKRLGRPPGTYTSPKKLRAALVVKLAAMGLVLDEPQEDIVGFISHNLPVRGWEEKFDIRNYVLRKLLYMCEKGYNDRVRLGALEMLAKISGLIQPGHGTSTGAVAEIEWGAEVDTRPIGIAVSRGAV